MLDNTIIGSLKFSTDRSLIVGALYIKRYLANISTNLFAITKLLVIRKRIALKMSQRTYPEAFLIFEDLKKKKNSCACLVLLNRIILILSYKKNLSHF